MKYVIRDVDLQTSLCCVKQRQKWTSKFRPMCRLLIVTTKDHKNQIAFKRSEVSRCCNTGKEIQPVFLTRKIQHEDKGDSFFLTL